MRSLPASLALVVIGAVLVGCTSSGAATSPDADSTASASTEPTAAVAGEDPLDLIGNWRISQAVGEEPGTVVRIGLGGFEIWRSCGDITGSWVANPSTLHGVVTFFSQSCMPLSPVTWVDDAVTYEASVDGVTVLSGDGSVLAVLTAVNDSELSADHLRYSTVSTDVDDRARDQFAGIVEVPADLQPAGIDDLLGKWVPVGRFTTDPHVEFSDGRWSGTDGCNDNGGRWILDAGRFASTTGMSTLVGCDGEQVPTWVMTARGAALDGEELVLLDIRGQELGRLIRA